MSMLGGYPILKYILLNFLTHFLLSKTALKWNFDIRLHADEC